MLIKYFMAVAIIVFGVVFSQEAFAQKIVDQKSANAARSPRDVAAVKVSDRELRSSNRSQSASFTGSDEGLAESVSRIPAARPTLSLIDTTTGEIVWADEFRSARRSSTAGRRRNLIDANIGKIAWKSVDPA